MSTTHVAPAKPPQDTSKPSLTDRFLDVIERTGNKLPDPAMLFIYGLALIFILSTLLSFFTFDYIHPVTKEVLSVRNLINGDYLAAFLGDMVTTFTSFAPLGVVLVAMMGIGVAENAGFINTAIKKALTITPARILTPALIAIGIFSHVAADAGYVLVIPIGGIIFYAAGRHPIAGIAAAFAGVSGGFSASFIPSSIDPLLAGFTESAAQLYDANYIVNPLSNYFFTTASSVLIILVGWYITDKIIEPRLKATVVDDDAETQDMDTISDRESRAFKWAGLTMLAGAILLVALSLPENSSLRDASGSLTSSTAPLMKSIVPLIFLLFMIPGIVYGKIAGTFSSSKDVIDSLSKTLGHMSSYMAMAFFIALFLKAFNDSHLGVLLALVGAEGLEAMNLSGSMTIVGIIFLSALVNLLVGSASAKWALIGTIFVPMLMSVGISPELSQAAYRIGDSSSNIITPMLPYFPLVVVYCQRYIKNTGIGTVASMMMPYTLVFIVVWTLFLLGYWALGFPLGIQGGYVYPAL
ncbi:p-aminobenzoyl-glutamate transport protein [invertebrate metagenome]|uniref:p-aminobenzoyl-glutamate transport protein n=1 Tax=invertebrate metagenome TaxID=1711999 RepID=A0A2H9T681_9ZZZZ